MPTPLSPTDALEGTVAQQVIAAGGCGSRPMETAESARIADLKGQQAVDFLCDAAELPMARINIPNTVKLEKSLQITVSSLSTPRGRWRLSLRRWFRNSRRRGVDVDV